MSTGRPKALDLAPPPVPNPLPKSTVSVGKFEDWGGRLPPELAEKTSISTGLKGGSPVGPLEKNPVLNTVGWGGRQPTFSSFGSRVLNDAREANGPESDSLTSPSTSKPTISSSESITTTSESESEKRKPVDRGT